MPGPRDRPSPNHGPRVGCDAPDLVVLHYTAMATAEAALERLCDPATEVSAHWLIAPDGTAWLLVPEERRAWHAGLGRWGAARDVNSRSIGIELANPGDAPFAAPQMTALEALLADMLGRWAIPPERVIAHSDMAPARKFDPGPRFDWRRLARSGLSVWPATAATGDPAALQDDLSTLGYDSDLPGETRLAAFRLRFRPWARGPADAADAGAAADLARRFPVDRGPAAS